MNKIPLSEIMQLSVNERMELIELIWDSLAAEPEFVEMTDDLRHELDRRLEALKADPGAGRPWAEIEARLLASG
ncbi:MAG TPA: addiction module protein [Longimicrobium sp.]|jgi:putative addiction module component (TIGR02574 family)